MLTVRNVTASIMTIVCLIYTSEASAGGLFGDAIEGLCGGCGAGKALDNAHRKIKKAVPPYGTLEEGGTRIVRESVVETAGPALAVAIRASRNDAVQAGTHEVPDQIRDKLINFYRADLIDSVRYRVGQGNELSVQANSIRFGDAAAVTLEDVIVFRNQSDALHNDVLWAHELKHVVQYQSWGLMKFAKHYVRSYRAVENEADAAEENYRRYGGATVYDTGVRIRNSSQQLISFSFQVDYGEWKEYKIESNDIRIYYCNGCMAKRYGIRIATERNDPIEYALELGRMYSIEWNSDRGLWDIYHISS